MDDRKVYVLVSTCLIVSLVSVGFASFTYYNGTSQPRTTNTNANKPIPPDLNKTYWDNWRRADSVSDYQQILDQASRYEHNPSSWHSPPSVSIGQGFGVESADYIVFKGDQDNVYVKSGDNGQIMYESSDAATVIQNAINAMTDRGTLFIKKGNYDMTSALSIPPDAAISIVGEGKQATSLEFNLPSTGSGIVFSENNQGSKLQDIRLLDVSTGDTLDPAIDIRYPSGSYQSLVSLVRVSTVRYQPWTGSRDRPVGSVEVGCDVFRAIDCDLLGEEYAIKPKSTNPGMDYYIYSCGLGALGASNLNPRAIKTDLTADVTPNINIFGGIITCPNGYGIQHKGQLRVEGCWFDRNYRAIHMEGGNQPVITHNRLAGGWNGGDYIIYLSGTKGGKISANTYTYENKGTGTVSLSAVIYLDATIESPKVDLSWDSDFATDGVEPLRAADPVNFSSSTVEGSWNAPVDLTTNPTMNAGIMYVYIPSGTNLASGTTVYNITDNLVYYSHVNAHAEIQTSGGIDNTPLRVDVRGNAGTNNRLNVLVRNMTGSTVTLTDNMKMLIKLM